MELPEFDLPVCPECGEDAMHHKCFSHIHERSQVRKNGWYCQSCGCGPKQLGKMIEAEAARFALKLIN